MKTPLEKVRNLISLYKRNVLVLTDKKEQDIFKGIVQDLERAIK